MKARVIAYIYHSFTLFQKMMRHGVSVLLNGQMLHERNLYSEDIINHIFLQTLASTTCVYQKLENNKLYLQENVASKVFAIIIIGWEMVNLLLQRPFQEILKSGKPDFPFCLCWANHEWTTKTWHKDGKNKVIAPMEYGGEKDYTEHFNYVLPAFKDRRYITIDEKPVFVIYDPYHF